MAEMTGVQPTFDINGNNNNGDWWGSLIGGAVGGAVGSGWGRNNGNGCNNGGCCNNRSDQFLMDTLTTMRTDVNSIGRDNLLQTAALQASNCQGFGGVHSTVERVGAQLAQGQSRTEAAIYSTALQNQLGQKDNIIFSLQQGHAAEVQGMRNSFDLMSAQKDCCCETNRNIDSLRFETQRQGCDTRAAIAECCCELKTAIHAEGEATRAKMGAIEREQLLRENSDLKTQNMLMKNQQFTDGRIGQLQNEQRQGMHHLMHDIIRYMDRRFDETAPTTGTGTGTGA